MTGQPNILLIEDDTMVRQALGRALASENYRVVPAANRQEALGELGKQQIDIVLLNLSPRNENGWETLRRLISLQPCLLVIAMTARPEQQQAESGGQEVDVLMEKPLNLPVLFQTLNRFSSQPPELRGGCRSRQRLTS